MPESADSSGRLPRRLQTEHELRVAQWWENLVLLHLGALIVGISWWFGGQSPGARQGLLVWGTVGAMLFVLLCGLHRGADARRAWRHLWPLAVFDVLVLISCFNPSTRLVMHEGEQMFLHTDPAWPWLPSSARPDLSLRELWQFNGIVLSCYNALLALPTRRAFRRLLTLIAGNALLLAIFGTFQKLSGAEGLLFGLVKTPQPYFFATFVYHNHWGAFTLLNLAACLGLLFHSLRRGGHRDFWHSPVPLGVVACIVIAATVPLSGSRSSTLLAGLLLLAALVHFLLHIVRTRRAHHESALLPVAGIVLAALVAVGATAYLSRDVIATRARHTTQQIERIRTEDTLNSRLTLYRDTWEMASRKPWFGWGLETYGDVFRIFNSQRAAERWIGAPHYREAHNDWFQSLAEVGFVGTGLIALLILSPLQRRGGWRPDSRLPGNLLAGCGFVLLYAWVEFPFANPSVMIAFWTSLYLAAGYARLDAASARDDNASSHA